MSDGPVLETARLRLRPMRREDVGGVHALTASEAARRYLSGGPQLMEDSYARVMRVVGHWAVDGFGTFVALDRANGALVGSCGPFRMLRSLHDGEWESVEAGWVVAPERWGEGLASEATAAALAWFDAEHGRAEPRTCCMIVPGNAASERIAARLGFRPFRDAAHKGDPVRLYERVCPG